MSSNRWVRKVWFTLALLIVAGACDGGEDFASGVTEPTLKIQESVVQATPRSGRQEPKKVRESADRRADRAAVTSSGRMIGSEGGTLEFRGHRLIVPAGAVAERTLFKVTQVEGGYIEIELKATRGRDRDVGHQGFDRPVTLELSYAGAEGIDDPSALAIGWVLEDGSIHVLPSVVDPAGQVVRAQLDHFSKYAMVAN